MPTWLKSTVPDIQVDAAVELDAAVAPTIWRAAIARPVSILNDMFIERVDLLGSPDVCLAILTLIEEDVMGAYRCLYVIKVVYRTRGSFLESRCVLWQS